MKRRSFLGFAATAPLAAKQVVSTKAAELAGMNIAGLAKAGLSPNGTIQSGGGIGTLTPSAAKKFLGGSVPDWKVEEWKRDSQHSRTISADVASLRSVSLTSKFRIEGDRYVENMKVTFFDQFKDDAGHKIRKEFQDKFGWWL